MPTPGTTVTHTSQPNGGPETDFTIQLVPPETSIPEGAVLVVIVRVTGTLPLGTPSGWSGNGFSRGRILRRIAGAAEPTSIVVTYGFDGPFAATAYMIPEGDATVSPAVTNGQDPPELATGWDVEDVGEIVYIAAWGSNRADHTLTSPSGYGSQTQIRSANSGATSECQLNTAVRVATNVTEDPGAWTVTAGSGVSVSASATIAVRIPPAAEPDDHELEGSATTPAPSLSGAAALELPVHETAANLTAPAPRISGAMVHGDEYMATGGLSAPPPAVSGAMEQEVPEHAATGAVSAPAPTLSASLIQTDGHDIEGAIVAPSPGMSGAASMELPALPDEPPLAVLSGGEWIRLMVDADAGWTESRRTPDSDSRRGYGREAYPRSGRRAVNRDIPFTSAELHRADALEVRAHLNARPLTLAGYLTRGSVTGVARAVRIANSPGTHLYARVEGEISLDPPPTGD